MFNNGLRSLINSFSYTKKSNLLSKISKINHRTPKSRNLNLKISAQFPLDVQQYETEKHKLSSSSPKPVLSQNSSKKIATFEEEPQQMQLLETRRTRSASQKPRPTLVVCPLSVLSNWIVSNSILVLFYQRQVACK